VAGAQVAARGQDLRAAAPVDRPVHTATAEQRRIRRVHDRVDRLRGDVALDERDLHGTCDSAAAAGPGAIALAGWAG
jgi:hypothetical protein